MFDLPNSQAQAVSNENTAPSAEPTKPVMGTTPTRQRNEAAATKTLTTTEIEAEGTEGEKATETTPQNNGQVGEPEVDYKVKFSESSSEAQRLLGILKQAGIDPKTGERIETGESTQAQAQEQGRPVVRGEQPTQPTVPLTDEQLTAAIPGFANLTEADKDVIRDMKATVKQITGLKNLVAELYDEKQFGKQFKDLTANEKWQKIGEHAEEFKEYAYQQENLTVPLETLAASFLYNKGLSTAKPKEQTPKPEGLEPGSGGGRPNGKSESEGYTPDEIARIRMTDPKKYANLAKSGKIKIRS